MASETHTVEHRLILGGTDYAERLLRAFAGHPDVTEITTAEAVSTGREGNYAVDVRIVYRASQRLDWHELMTVARHVPLYDVDVDVVREELAAEAQRRGITLAELCEELDGDQQEGTDG